MMVTASPYRSSKMILSPEQVSGSSNWQLKSYRSLNQTFPLEYPSMAIPNRAPIPPHFHGAFQHGFMSIFYSVGINPMDCWEKQIRAGTMKRVLDYEIRSQSLELISNNIMTTFITSPPGPHQSLEIRLPVIVLVVKNLKRYFLFEIQILDDTNTRRRFKVSNYHTGVKVRPFLCMLPVRLEEGWNQVMVNLHDMTRKTFGTGYVHTIRVQVHANCRLRRIYFCEKAFGEEDVPADFKSYVVNSSKSSEQSPSTLRRKNSSFNR